MAIRNRKIMGVENGEYHVYLTSDKDRTKFVFRVERIIRSSMEYKDMIAFLKDYIDMTKCAFFQNVSSEGNRRIKIEIHHEPLTLFDIVSIVLNKWETEGIPLNDMLIADEVMGIHYFNNVGLIPLSQTVHNTVHDNEKLVIPLYMVYGNYKEFIKEYQDYIPEEIYDKLEKKIALTRAIKEDSFDILKSEFEYLEIDGIKLPSKLGETE